MTTITSAIIKQPGKLRYITAMRSASEKAESTYKLKDIGRNEDPQCNSRLHLHGILSYKINRTSDLTFLSIFRP